MTEHEIRRKIYTLELKPNTKLTLLGVLDIVNWQTWQSQCSSKDVSKRMSMKETSVRRAFTELVKLGLISRVAERRVTEDGKVHHHRAVTRLNIKAIIGSQTLAHSELTPLAHKEPPLAHSELTPLAHSELTPTLIMSYNTTEGTTGEYNRETTEETQQTSLPDDDAQTVEADDAAEVDESHYPQALRDFARMRKISCAEAQVIVDNMNRKAESVARDRERGVNFNRPTTSYRPY